MSVPHCLVWNVDPVLWHGPIDIRWYGLIFVVVFLLGWRLFKWQLGRGGYDDQLAMDFIVWAMLGAVLGGWLVHHLFYAWPRVSQNPLVLIPFVRFTPEGIKLRGIRGLASHGSTLGLVVALVWFARKRGIPVWEMIDRFTFSSAGGAALVRLGNLFNSEILGRPTSLPWAFCFPLKDHPMVPRHPSQIYEFLIGVLVMGILYLTDRVAGRERRPLRLMTGVFFTSYFSLRFLVEFVKAHQALSAGSVLTMGQLLSLPFVVAGVVITILALKAGPHERTVPPASVSASTSGRSRSAPRKASGKGRHHKKNRNKKNKK